MKKQLFLLGCVASLSFAACNDSGTGTTTAKDSTITTTTQTNTERRGAMIANFDTRKFMDLKTNKPVKLHWDADHYYYVDELGSQPYYYYDPIAKDTFDYWGRRLNGYITSSNGDYILDESRMPAMDMSTPTMDTSSTSTSGDTKIKSKDDMYKEKTDSTKLKITDDKIKVKKK